jgi:hypothetical protein
VTRPLAATLMMNPCWPHVAPLLSVESGTALASGRAHRRIEIDVSKLSDRQLAMVLGVRVACAACGATICPFRRRFGASAGRAARPGRLYTTVACPLDVSLGCARGKAASEATEALAAAIQGYQSGATSAESPGTREPSQIRLRGIA